MAGCRYSGITVERLLELVRSGLHGGAPNPSLFTEDTDWESLYRLAHDQTVVCLASEGIDRLPSSSLPKDETRLDPFVGDTLMTASRNSLLNSFIPKLFHRLEGTGAVLVKGQSLAPFYPSPMKRQPGDIDILLMDEGYQEAKKLLLPKASKVEEEVVEILHQGLFYGSVEVELHGRISTGMSRKLDKKLLTIQKRMFSRPERTFVEIGGEDIPVPDQNFNALYIFIHFLQHYWSSGLGLRQIVDWAVFLRKNNNLIDLQALRSDLEDLSLMRLWRSFGCFAVEYLGFSKRDIPFYDGRYSGKGEKILSYLLSVGNFGKLEGRKDNSDMPVLLRKMDSFRRKVAGDRLRHFGTFPGESLRFFFGAFGYGIKRLTDTI